MEAFYSRARKRERWKFIAPNPSAQLHFFPSQAKLSGILVDSTNERLLE